MRERKSPLTPRAQVKLPPPAAEREHLGLGPAVAAREHMHLLEQPRRLRVDGRAQERRHVEQRAPFGAALRAADQHADLGLRIAGLQPRGQLGQHLLPQLPRGLENAALDQAAARLVAVRHAGHRLEVAAGERPEAQPAARERQVVLAQRRLAA